MASHFLHLIIYSSIVAGFFAVLVRRRPLERIRLAALIWGAMVGGTLALAYLMYPFPA